MILYICILIKELRSNECHMPCETLSSGKAANLYVLENHGMTAFFSYILMYFAYNLQILYFLKIFKDRIFTFTLLHAFCFTMIHVRYVQQINLPPTILKVPLWVPRVSYPKGQCSRCICMLVGRSVLMCIVYKYIPCATERSARWKKLPDTSCWVLYTYQDYPSKTVL